MNNEIKRISEIFEGGFFPDTEKIDLKEIIDKDIVILDAIFFVNQWNKEAVVFKFRFEGGIYEYSTVSSSQSIVKKLKFAKEKGALPCIGKVIKVKNYFDIV